MTVTIRVRLNEELFRKYKAFCAIDNISMTQQTQKIVSDFIKDKNDKIKIIRT